MNAQLKGMEDHSLRPVANPQLIARIHDDTFKSPLHRATMLTLACYDTPEHGCFPSVATLAKKVGVSERYMHTIIADLKVGRYIRVKSGGRKRRTGRTYSNRYTFYPAKRGRKLKIEASVENNDVRIASGFAAHVEAVLKQHKAEETERQQREEAARRAREETERQQRDVEEQGARSAVWRKMPPMLNSVDIERWAKRSMITSDVYAERMRAIESGDIVFSGDEWQGADY